MARLEWIEGTCYDKPSPRVLQNVFVVYGALVGFHLDSSYLEEIQECHGGVPKRQWFKSRTGKDYRVGRFVNYLDEQSLSGPFRPCRRDPSMDERLLYSWLQLDGIANIGSGMGLFLLPFAALFEWCEHDPDQMDPTHVNFVCFDYKGVVPGARPKIVAWDNDAAVDEIYRLEGLDVEQRLLQMDHSKMTDEVCENFDIFVEMLEYERQ